MQLCLDNKIVMINMHKKIKKKLKFELCDINSLECVCFYFRFIMAINLRILFIAVMLAFIGSSCHAQRPPGIGNATFTLTDYSVTYSYPKK